MKVADLRLEHIELLWEHEPEWMLKHGSDWTIKRKWSWVLENRDDGSTEIPEHIASLLEERNENN